MKRTTIGIAVIASLMGCVLSNGAAADDEIKLEEGFVSFFNGKNLTGWKLHDGNSLDGQTEAPKKRFQVVDGQLVVDGKTRGNMVIDTVKQFAGDVHIKFQYKPDAACNNDLYIRGVKFDIKKGGVKNIDVDAWNDFEIIVSGDDVEFKNNGESQRTAKVKSASSPLGVRAEFGAISYRNLRYKE